MRALAAAEELFAEQGVEATTMDQVAARAGVGKGTLYRRFGDKAGLASVLLSERGRELQQAVLAGPPPLGPGAPADRRLVAFVEAYLAFQSSRVDLVLLSETGSPGARLRKPAYAFWRQHCTVLLTETGAPHAATRAEALLACLAAEQVQHWLREGRPHEEIRATLTSIAASLTDP